MSTRIPLEGLANTRDLGGMRTSDGRRIVYGRLIRSGNLIKAKGEDLPTLTGVVGTVVDFRTEREREENPDPELPGAESLHIPVLENQYAGISRDEGSDEEAFAIVARDPDKARQYMIDVYTHFVTNAFSIAQYRKFVRLLLDSDGRAIVWHCTAGKDRAGFATVIVQELLGVDRASIMADYLKTNEYLAEEIRMLNDMVGREMGGLDERSEKALHYLFSAEEEFLTAIYEKTEEVYGSFEGFLEKGLGITPEERERLKAMYLE